MIYATRYLFIKVVLCISTGILDKGRKIHMYMQTLYMCPVKVVIVTTFLMEITLRFTRGCWKMRDDIESHWRQVHANSTQDY